MRKRYLHIAFTMLLSLIMQAAHAQLVRYVTTTGTYAGDGLSWATAKNNLQDAINDLHNHMVQAGITEGGCIYVAQGTYKPTESTEQMGGGVLFTAFKLYGGISVYGGYAGTETGDDLLPENREMKSATGKPWELKYETILSGNHSSSTPTTFTWNAKKETYDTSFPGNSYHVVWFATNGFDENGRAKPLNGTALMDGFTIEGGCAGNRTVENDREHNAFGGGAYMVEGAQLKHCIVQKNESTRRGGGLYLDGGGEVDYCYLHTNQCLGLGIVAGYGGGVCVEGNGKVLHSLIHNNTARIGGGAALSAEGVAGMECFNPAMAGCVVSNNTTTTEGGGVFLYQGGQMNHCSVVRNKCTGPNIIIQGRRYGRSAGVYVDNAAMIVNSVLWGGQVDANDDVQYAAYTPNSTDVLKPYMNYTAVSNHDLADWTSTSKLEVMAVGAVNSGTGGRFPDFLPGTDGKAVDDIPCGVETDAAATPESRWKPAGFSPLRERGVQVVDFAINERALRSHITTDIDGKSFAPRTSLGAYVSERTKYAPVLLPSIEDNAQKAYTLFVDPDREIMDLSTATHVGHSWAAPLGNINDALLWFSSYKGQEIEYYDGASASSTTTGTMPTTATLQIVVKAGTCTTAGTYYSTRMRTSYLQMQDNVHLFGGYPDAATDRDLSGRDPLKNLTTISANIIDNGYQFNTCHVIGFGGANHAIVDGFRLAYAYSLPNKDLNNTVGTGSELYFNPILRDGGAVLLQDKIGGYGSMIGNKVRNCIVANCTSERGAAVFVQSSRSDVEIEVEFENCIIHNNTSTFETAATTPSAIYIESEAGGSVQVKFNHCNILKNVGYALQIKGAGATVQLDNSMIWANATQAFARSEELADNANTAFISPILLETGATLSGTNNLLDASATVPAGLTDTENKLTYLRSETTAEGITKEIYTYPVFVNPTKNIGATEEGDLTNYGGTVNFMPRNMNPMVNAAADASMSGTDISTNITRTYGGAADIGAVENNDTESEGYQPQQGRIIYVRDYGNTTDKGGDGSSWSKAINGNCTLYTNDHGFQGYDAELYAEDAALTGLQWAVDEAYYRSLKKDGSNNIAYTTKSVYKALPPGSNWIERSLKVSSIEGSQQRVQVWVAKGEYLRREGFFMRDGVDVYGGFPAEGNPGQGDRQPRTYETIIETNTTEEVNDPAFDNWGTYLADVAANDASFPSATGSTWSIVDFSSDEITGDAGEVAHVIDNNHSTIWHTTWRSGHGTQTTSPHFVTIDLGEEMELYNVIFKPRNYGFNNVEVWLGTSVDNLTKVYTGSYPAYAPEQTFSFSTTTARYLKMVFSSPVGSDFVDIYEIGVNDHYNESAGYTGATHDLNFYAYAYKGNRVLTQPFPYYKYYSDVGSGHISHMELKNEIEHGFAYDTSWDGLVIQNGRTRIQHQRDGGAGVALRYNGHIKNCVIRNNYNTAYWNTRGGGAFQNDGIFENCVFAGNKIIGTNGYSVYGGGLYLRSGTVFNSIFHHNSLEHADDVKHYGTAVFFEVAKFYNNTITKNEGSYAMYSGNYFAQFGYSGYLEIYNSIICDNTVTAGTNEFDFETGSSSIYLTNCLFKNSTMHKDFTSFPHINNIYHFDDFSGSTLFADAANDNYIPHSTSPAINKGTEELGNDTNGDPVTLPAYDAAYDTRIQDCTVDIGAYEFNGAYSISPTTGTADDGVTPTASFFVTGPGHGTASAANAANAACMQKLQKVLDAAGRYKFDHPNTQVIVKLARVAGGGYAPSRSSITDLHDLELENPRTYTLMVPRGVEVWGGYTEDFTTRDVIANPTKLTGAYTADGQNVNCYHVVTFTNDLFDENGEKIGTGHTTTSWNGVTDPTLDPASSTASEKLNVQARAILDGLFIEDGDASGEIVVTGEKYREQNTNRYGGAAIVTNFAHVRNCILKNNQAAYGGGALFLEEGALVSGCVMEDNTAEWGGAVYVKQNSDAGFKPTEWENIVRFAHLYSCTIVKNQAHDAGGGLWFNNNLRVNSSVVWQNTGNNSANVCGQTDPYSTSAETKTSIYYPFTYSAIENLRAPGMNNISVHTEDSKGVRFDLTNDPYYYLHRHSVLARAGMDAKTYNELRTVDKTVAAEKYFYYPTLETHDLAGNPRTTYNLDGEGNDITATDKDFIEIGARAFNGPLMVMPDKTKLITRLFVVKPENVDEDIYNIMADQDYVEGSSFAFPLQKLDDALLYIQNARKLYGEEAVTVDDPGAIGKKESDGTCKVKNLKFEVFVSQGTYYPYRTVSGQYDYSRGNTFLVPEGVSIYGGVSHKKAEGKDGAFYTQHSYKADGVTDADDVIITSSGKTITLKATNTRQILDGRELEDLNHNSIREPWEMKNQTILSGKSVNSESADNVYHVITCIADEDYVGTLPEGTSETSSLIIADTEREYTGVPIVLDGLQIMDGKAMGYDKSSVTNAYTYYRGGGVLVDGNWFKATRTDEGELPESDENYTRAADPRSVGRRSIPLTVRNCEFTNNRAGAGGAIFSNGVVELYSCNFAQNAAKRRAETNAPAAAQRSNGNGGAVFSSYVLSAVNTIFANNEAGVAEETGDLSLLDEVGSRGGAVFHAANGQYGSMQLMNCNFVRNQALSYPALYVLYPNRGGLLRKENPHKVINSIFWQNVVRTGDDITVNGEQKQMSLACNYWNRINQAFVAERLEFTDSRTDDDGNPQIGEMLWFCAYEDGLGCVPHFDDRNVIDYRTAEYTDVDAADPTLDKYIPVDVFTNVTYYERDEDGNIVQKTATNNGENAKYKWVTNNIYLAADNNALDGPNFVNPSLGAGVNNYLPSADWMVSRQNNLTDNGWTRIRQSVTADENGTAYSCEFVDSDPSDNFPADAHGIYADTRKVRTQQGGSGLYIKMPIGDERYMQSASTDAILYRISKDPNPSQHQTFIDLGVYEYQHLPLIPSTAEEVDILWVSTQEKPENGEANGSSWLQPTSDLQRAIETLLASRNNHRKQINIIEGNYSPIYTIDSYMSFTINTGSLNTAATLPEHRGTTANGDFGVHSLTFQGGWSKDVKDVRDVEAYPTVWEMAGRSGVASEKMSTLLRISDAHNWYNTGSAATTVPATGEQKQRVIPIEIDGVTFQNTYGNQPESGSDMGEGAAIHYAPQYQYKLNSSGKPFGTEGNYIIDTETGGEKKLALAPAGKPKLTIGRSVCRLNGTGSTVPAVTIGEGGGYSIIYNTLFHSNAGRSLTANNTRVVNCTFALNGDKVKLLDDRSATPSTHSLLMNSLLWRNGAANQDDDPTDAYEYELPSVTADYLAHNAIYGSVYTGDDTVNPYNGVISIKVGEGSNNTTNHSLTGTNSDVLGGPNFMNPLPQAVSEDDKLLRDFHLRPSARTINQGDDLTYAKQALDKAAALTDAEKLAETDLAYMPRFKSARIDRGAYEFQGELQRVIYTDPNKMTTGTGETWGSPYGYGDLQSAIDLAAVFYTINEQRAYVFCKGGQKTGETLTPRAGVNVYAGIASNYTREATKEKTDDGDNTDGGYAKEDLHDYITYVLGDRTGIVTPNASRTGINGIQTTGAYPVYALMDGFDVTPAANVTRPVIDLGDADEALPVAVRNSVVHDTYNINMVSENGAAAAVRLRGGLLYNVLVRDCSASQSGVAATWLGTKARAVNCTFLGKGENGYAIETKASVPQVFHSITWNPDHTGSEPVARLGTTASAYQNCNTNEEGYPFARYLQPVADNHPARPAAYTGNQDLWYQLEEMSKQMDCTDTGITHEALYSNLQSALGLTETEPQALIDYSSDRDLLGNPRLPQYNALIDRGCYETWNVPEDTAAQATYHYDRTGTAGRLSGGRRHPQEGSVVYLHAGASLVMSRDDFNPESAGAAGRNEVLRPGYLLLREGASLYSEGTAVSLPHVGVERTISNADAGALVALPYAFDYSQARLVSYHEAGGQLQQAVPGAGTEVFYYDGAQRAEGGYEAQTQDSPCWKPWTAGEREACMGVWYKPATAGTYRFTAADVTALGTDPIYREGYYGDTSEKQKTVSLTQADDRNTNGSKPDYTTPENMGWNLVGCPYLVSNYVSWANGEATDFDPEAYPMSLPRFVYTTDAAGQFTSWPSWKEPTEGSFAPAHAFFTQTATLQATETLTFILPHYTGTPVAAVPRPCLSFTDGSGQSDVVTLQPCAEATEDMGFHLGSDGLHWAPLNPELPQLYAASTGTAHLDWMGAAPVGTEIPLGLYSGMGGFCTFSLPSPETYATFTHVWLTDRQTGRVTDLKQNTYTVPLETDETTDIRFTLKFGGIAPSPGNSGEQALYQITARQGYIRIEGLTGGERIAVYDASGRLLLSDQARTNLYAAPFLPGNYVVKVEGYSRKVQVAP